MPFPKVLVLTLIAAIHGCKARSSDLDSGLEGASGKKFNNTLTCTGANKGGYQGEKTDGFKIWFDDSVESGSAKLAFGHESLGSFMSGSLWEGTFTIVRSGADRKISITANPGYPESTASATYDPTTKIGRDGEFIVWGQKARNLSCKLVPLK